MGIFRVALVARFNGVDETRNVFTFDGGGGGLPSIDNATSWLNELYTSTVLAQITTKWQTNKVVIEEPLTAGHWGFVLEGNYIKQGTNATDATPQQIAAVVVGITASRRRGKKFIAGLASVNVNDGVLGAGMVTVLAAYGTAYISNMITDGGEAISGVCKPDGSLFIAFNSFRVDPIVGTQRRRKQGVGI